MNNINKEYLEYYKKLDDEIKMIPLTYDKQFKAVFIRNEDILKEFLILELDLNMNPIDTKIFINDVVLPSKINKEYQKTVDILVFLDDDIITNIETNRSPYENVKQRNCVYIGKICGTVLKEGDKPSKLKEKQIYQLNINANKDDNKKGHDEFEIRSKITNKPLLDNFNILVKNIAFYHNLYYTKHKKLTKSELWLVALSCETFSELYEIISQILDEDKAVKFMESVIIMSQDEVILKDWERKLLDDLVEYTSLENAKKDGLEQGLEQGIKEGISQNKIEIAKNLLKEKISIDIISKTTGLSEEEIGKLQ